MEERFIYRLANTTPRQSVLRYEDWLTKRRTWRVGNSSRPHRHAITTARPAAPSTTRHVTMIDSPTGYRWLHRHSLKISKITLRLNQMFLHHLGTLGCKNKEHTQHFISFWFFRLRSGSKPGTSEMYPQARAWLKYQPTDFQKIPKLFLFDRSL